jgi:hypothetical protein
VTGSGNFLLKEKKYALARDDSGSAYYTWHNNTDAGADMVDI